MCASGSRCKDRAGTIDAVLCLQILAEKLAEGLPIRHGMVVDQIIWGGEGVTLHCQGGEQVQADAVIVTVSLGVLKVVMLLHCSCASIVLSACAQPPSWLYGVYAVPSEAWVKNARLKLVSQQLPQRRGVHLLSCSYRLSASALLHDTTTATSSSQKV